ncbi:putative tail tape measure protein [uncultured virus]|uniref:Putative tail tape measure protein n=1 Tax=uncultured virus TaxID=340016 RepID=A0A218MNE2_9VIRU|nr:putative tail tape measure protein [uncultured virus]
MFGNSSSVVDIGISMSLRDQFTTPAGNIGRAWHNMMNGITQTAYNAQTSFANTVAMSMNVLKSLESAFEYSAKVQDNSFLTTKMINDGLDHQKELLEQAQAINLRNPLTAMDITSGQKFMAMAGMGFEQIKGAVEPAAQLAAIFNMPMGQKGGTADLMTNIMSMYNLDPSKAKSVADVLGVGVTSANTSMEDLAQAIKYSGATARMAGMNIKEHVAAIGVLGNSGIQGSMAGTAISNAINMFNKAISGTSKGGAKVLKALGLDKDTLTDAQGKLIPIAKLVQLISEKTRGMSSVDQYQVYFNLFGQRGIRAMYSLVQDYEHNNKFAEIMGKLNTSEGWSEKTMEEKMETPLGAIQMMSSAFENLKVTGGAVLAKVFVPLMHLAGNFFTTINNFSKSGLGKILIQGLTLLTMFKGIRALFGFFVIGMKNITSTMRSTNTASNLFKTNMGASNIAASQMEIHLRNCMLLLNRMAVVQGLSTGIGMVGKRGNLMPLRDGYTTELDKNGRLRYRVAKGFTSANGKPGGTFVSPEEALMMGAAMGSNRPPTPTQNPHGKSPLFRSLKNFLPKSLSSYVAAPLAKVGSGIANIASKGLGFLMGPWGFGLSLGISFIPSILDFLKGDSNSKEQQIKSAEQRQAQRDAELVRAIANGKAASISIDLNGSNVGTFSDGDKASVDLGGPQFEMNDYGM